jgi:hypothetical protein
MTSMNATPYRSDRPRLVCRVIRSWCAVSERRPAHARSCPSCQAYFQAADNLESTLRKATSHTHSEVLPSSPDFEHAILRAVRTSTSVPERSRRRAPSRTWVMGGLSAVTAMVAIALSVNVAPPASPPTRVVSTSSAEEAALILNTVESLSTELVGSVIPSAGQFVAENPLQQEIGYVYSDVRSALDFLALNFLPTTGAKPAAPEQSRPI